MSILLDECISLRGDSSTPHMLHTLGVLALDACEGLQGCARRRAGFAVEHVALRRGVFGQIDLPVEVLELVLAPGLHGEALAGPMGRKSKQRGDKSF
jgi:hypothetical protein